MDKHKQYINFPVHIVVIRVFLALSMIFTGLYLVYRFNLMAFGGYLFFILLSLFLFLKYGCSRCVYYGQLCDLSISKMVPLVFKKRNDPEAFTCFSHNSYPWITVFVLVPVLAGIANLIRDYQTIHLYLFIICGIEIGLVTITSFTLSCPRCRMNEVCSLGKIIYKKQ